MGAIELLKYFEGYDCHKNHLDIVATICDEIKHLLKNKQTNKQTNKLKLYKVITPG